MRRGARDLLCQCFIYDGQYVANELSLVTTLAIISCPRQTFKISPTQLLSRRNYSFLDDQKLISLLQSCKRTCEITQVHGFMVKTSLDLAPFTLSKLLASSILDTRYAVSIFNEIQHPNLFMFNTMLRGYSTSGDLQQALILFNRIRANTGILLDQFSFISTLKSCSQGNAMRTGCGLHSIILRSGYDLSVNVKNTLLHFYCINGRMEDAHRLFDEFPQQRDLVSWNTLMGGYLCISNASIVIDLFKQICRSGIKFSITSSLCIFSATGDLKFSLGGESLHGYCIKIGFIASINIIAAIISMYGKTGHIYSGHKIFNEVPEKDVVLWNCLIYGYAKSGLLEEGLALLQQMKLEKMMPNSSTLVGMLSACAATGSLNIGQCIYGYIKEKNLVLDEVLGTALIDMYSKCGCLNKAADIFDIMRRKDVKLWTAMISCYGFHGQAKKAVMLFYRMEDEGFMPNEVTFLAVLSACSHGGLVLEGIDCFVKMVQEYGFPPKIEHYGCMIDLLGRKGLIEEAYNLIRSLPVERDATVWRAMLAACRVYGNVRFGKLVKRELVESYDEHPTDSALLSSTYAIAGRLMDHKEMVELKDRHIFKEAGLSSIEMDSLGQVHNLGK